MLSRWPVVSRPCPAGTRRLACEPGGPFVLLPGHRGENRV